MAPPGFEAAARTAALVLLLLVAGIGPARAAPVPAATPQALLNAARLSLSAGDASAAMETIRQMRDRFPDSPLLADAEALNVQAALALGDVYRARYFLQRLLASSPASHAAFSATMSVARAYYDSRAWLAALDYYARAVDLFRSGTSGTRGDLDLALLHSSELALYRQDDADKARGFLKRISGTAFPPAEAALYRQLRVRLLWSALSPAALGLKDANISSLRVDGDDLWVGTWNGGVSRFSLSAGSSDPFTNPPYVRSIEATDRRVWIGTSDGLSWYGKGTGRWGTADTGADGSSGVPAIRSVGGRLYVGTLGAGLLRQDGDGWSAASDGSLPGRFITSLAEDPARARLYIGTMNIGLVILDLATGQMSTLAEAVPSFTSENITTILVARDGRIWIGTYGDGLALWDPSKGSLQQLTKDSGPQLGDDWILSSCETDRALYFGSFGGGVSVFSKTDGSWRRIGIREGLSSLDVAAIAWKAPRVFFGTLGSGVSVYDEDSDGALP